jgi:hypothetical protein
MTRATYSLTGIEGPLFFDKDGQLTFLEKDGIDYAPATVQVIILLDCTAFRSDRALSWISLCFIGAYSLKN